MSLGQWGQVSLGEGLSGGMRHILQLDKGSAPFRWMHLSELIKWHKEDFIVCTVYLKREKRSYKLILPSSS